MSSPIILEKKHNAMSKKNNNTSKILNKCEVPFGLVYTFILNYSNLLVPQVLGEYIFQKSTKIIF